MTKMKFPAAVLAALLLTLCAQQSAHAEPTTLQVNGAWQQFFWDDAAGTIEEPIDGYRLTISQAAYLRITDAGLPGDSFNLTVNNLLFSTPNVAAAGGTPVNNPALAFQNPIFSSGQFTLQPGTYLINISLRNALPGGGTGYIQAAPVPEPLTMFLFGSGLAGLAGVVRRRRQQ